MDTSNISAIKSISDIPNFPFNSFEQVVKEEKQKNIKIGSAMDTARKWVSEGASAPKKARNIMRFLIGLYILLPISLIVFSLVTKQYLLCLYTIPMFIFLFFLRPATVRLNTIFKLIIWAGYAFIVWYFVNSSHTWALYWGLVIIIPWFLNKIIYRYSTIIVTEEALKSEERFVELFKHNVIALELKSGEHLWGSDLIK